MAADSAVMVIDGSKGVEAQTIKLFKVCVMRHIPIFTFINKMDREARDPFELMSEIEEVLGIHTCPVNWPIGCGKNFKGVYDRQTKTITTFTAAMGGQKEVASRTFDVEGDVDAVIGSDFHAQLKDDIELFGRSQRSFDQELVNAGKLSPVFFGSALTNFGVETFLEHFLKMTSSPLPRRTTDGEVDPFDEKFSAFVFKIQANMNKAHRDRIAFMRICSGRFQAGMEVNHVQGGKKIRLTQPQQLMAESRKIIEEAYAGDIIGVFDPGIFSIGDTLCESNENSASRDPHLRSGAFCPGAAGGYHEAKTVYQGDQPDCPGRARSRSSRSLIPAWRRSSSAWWASFSLRSLIYRLKNEYNVEVKLDQLPFEYIRWIENPGEVDVAKIQGTSDMKRICDLKEIRCFYLSTAGASAWWRSGIPSLSWRNSGETKWGKRRRIRGCTGKRSIDILTPIKTRCWRTLPPSAGSKARRIPTGQESPTDSAAPRFWGSAPSGRELRFFHQ